MKAFSETLLIVVALVTGGSAGHALASETPPTTLDYLQDCVVDEQSDCAQRCLTEHNCCVKSCNWVEKRAKTKCIAHCKSVLKKCTRECDQKAATDKPDETPPEISPRQNLSSAQGDRSFKSSDPDH